MDEVRHDVVEQALVVGDDQEAAVRRAQAVDAVGDDLQGVDVEPGVGLVEDRQARLEHRHVEDLVALLLAAGEALVDRPVEQRLLHLHQLHALLDQLEEVHGVHLRLAAVLADGVQRGLEEVGVGDAGDLHRVLEGQEHALAGALLGVHLQQVPAVEEHLALGDLVVLAAGEHLGQGGLAGAVRPHDGVHLPGSSVRSIPLRISAPPPRRAGS